MNGDIEIGLAVLVVVVWLAAKVSYWVFNIVADAAAVRPKGRHLRVVGYPYDRDGGK